MLVMEPDRRPGRFSSRPARIIGVPLWLRLAMIVVFGFLAVLSSSSGFTILWAALAGFCIGVTLWAERPLR